MLWNPILGSEEDKDRVCRESSCIGAIAGCCAGMVFICCTEGCLYFFHPNIDPGLPLDENCNSLQEHEWRWLSDSWAPCCQNETNQACEIRTSKFKKLQTACSAKDLRAKRPKFCCKWEEMEDCAFRRDAETVKKYMTEATFKNKST